MVNEPDLKGTMDISGNARVTLSKISYVYNEKAEKPAVTIKEDSMELTKKMVKTKTVKNSLTTKFAISKLKAHKNIMSGSGVIILLMVRNIT